MKNKFTIGYSSLSEAIPSVAFRTQTIIRAAQNHPTEIDLIIGDNDLDDEKAIANAQLFVENDVDLAIIFHIGERIGTKLRGILMPRPIIAVDIPIQLAHYFGANNQYAGQLVGRELGQWVNRHWDGKIDRLLILTDARVVSVVRERMDSAVKGLQEFVNITSEDTLYLDAQSTREIALERTLEILPFWSGYEHIAVIGVNDDVACGALDAAIQLGCEDHLVIGGQGADKLVREHFKMPNPRIVASTDYRLEQYGPKLIDLAVRIINKERVPMKTYIDHICVTPEMVKNSGE